MQLLPYRLIAAGKGCSNVYKGLSLSVGSVQACADSACADPDCGQVFEVSKRGDSMRCSCVSPGQPCAEVGSPSASYYEIGDLSTCAEASGDCFATLFENGDFTGWSGSFAEGSFPSSMFEEHGAMDKGASSLFVSGDGCTATLYQNADHTGWAVTFPEGSYSLEELLAQGAVDDDTSAIIVRHGPGGPDVEGLPSSASQPTPGAAPDEEAQGQGALEGAAADAPGQDAVAAEAPAEQAAPATAAPLPPESAPAQQGRAGEPVSTTPAPPEPPTPSAPPAAGAAKASEESAPAEPALAAAQPPASTPPAPAAPPPQPPPTPAPVAPPPSTTARVDAPPTPPPATTTPRSTTPRPTPRPTAPPIQRAPRPAARPPQSRVPAPPPWEPLKCDVVSKKDCTSEEEAYIQSVQRSFGVDHSRLEHEAARIKAKHGDVRAELRPWIEKRVQILQRLAVLAKRKTEL